MKNGKQILFTAGRGPTECSLAVHGIQKKFQEYLNERQIEYSIVVQNNGRLKNSIHSILFEINCEDHIKINSWIGTILWKCQSPIRKTHKRKNWYIKTVILEKNRTDNYDLSDISFQAFRASGPGGQHRNKVETAIRATHKKSGITVTSTDGKSQQQNKNKALSKLKQSFDEINMSNAKIQNLKQWSAQIEVERGNPIQTFIGLNFKPI